MQWLQLYVNKNRDITRKIVENAERRGCKGLFITVDAPQLGRREKGTFHLTPTEKKKNPLITLCVTDMRIKFFDTGPNVQQVQGDGSQGVARSM